jgi:hypothetical protein
MFTLFLYSANFLCLFYLQDLPTDIKVDLADTDLINDV